MTQRENGWKNCRMSSEYTEPHLANQQGRPLFNDLLEIGFPILRTSSFDLSGNNGLLEKNLDFIEERRENAMV